MLSVWHLCGHRQLGSQNGDAQNVAVAGVFFCPFVVALTLSQTACVHGSPYGFHSYDSFSTRQFLSK